MERRFQLAWSETSAERFLVSVRFFLCHFRSQSTKETSDWVLHCAAPLGLWELYSNHSNRLSGPGSTAGRRFPKRAAIRHLRSPEDSVWHEVLADGERPRATLCFRAVKESFQIDMIRNIFKMIGPMRGRYFECFPILSLSSHLENILNHIDLKTFLNCPKTSYRLQTVAMSLWITEWK
jgi:hypothetical protein